MESNLENEFRKNTEDGKGNRSLSMRKCDTGKSPVFKGNRSLICGYSIQHLCNNPLAVEAAALTKSV